MRDHVFPSYVHANNKTTGQPCTVRYGYSLVSDIPGGYFPKNGIYEKPEYIWTTIPNTGSPPRFLYPHRPEMMIYMYHSTLLCCSYGGSPVCGF